MVALIGAVAALPGKNAIHSALFLLLNFSSIAVLYLLLRAPFLFAVQLIVYAGAIIVLFLFVVMLLGAERAGRAGPDRLAAAALALIMALLLLGRGGVCVLRAREHLAIRQPPAPRTSCNAGQDRRGPVQQLPAAVRDHLGDPAGHAGGRGGAAHRRAA